MDIIFKEAKKYKIIFPINFDITNAKSAYDLLMSKAILIEMLYKNKIIHR